MQCRIEIADAIQNGLFASSIRGEHRIAKTVETEFEQPLQDGVNGRGDRELDVQALNDLEWRNCVGGVIGCGVFQGSDALK